ncbi:hypothetical protein Tco_0002907 [Tanacetum coccineum]
MKGHFDGGTTRGIIAEGTEGPINLGPERPRVYSELSQDEKDRYNADIRATNIILQGLPKDIYSLINHYIDANDIWDNVKMLLEGSKLTKEDRESQLRQGCGSECSRSTEQEVRVIITLAGCRGVGYWKRSERVGYAIGVKLIGGQDNAFDEDVDEQPVQDLALNVDNVFQADDCDAYDSDVDDAPTAQTLFMANLSSADPVYDEDGVL